MVVLAEVLQDKMDYQTTFIMALAENKLLLVQEDHQRNLRGIPSKLNSDVEHQPVILQMEHLVAAAAGMEVDYIVILLVVDQVTFILLLLLQIILLDAY